MTLDPVEAADFAEFLVTFAPEAPQSPQVIRDLYICWTLERYGGHRTQTAKALGMSYAGLKAVLSRVPAEWITPPGYYCHMCGVRSFDG